MPNLTRTIPWFIAIAALLAVAILLRPGYRASPTNVATDSDACTTCIALNRVTTIGDPEGPGYVSGQILYRDSHGHYLSPRQEDGIAVFDRSGAFVELIGRQGDGPGEFRSPTAVSGVPGNTGGFLVYDRGTSRISHFGAQHDFVGSTFFAYRTMDAIVLTTGEVLVQGRDFMVGREVKPFFLLDVAADSIVRIFGAVQGDRIAAEELYGGRRPVAASSDGTFWSARMNRYRLERWSSSGNIVETIDRDVPWFQPYSETTWQSLEEAPQPFLAHIHQDSSGLVWTFVTAPASDWSDHLRMTDVGGGREMLQPDAMDALFDTIVEVIDPTAMRVVASQRFPELIAGIIDDSTVYSSRERDGDIPFLDVWRLRLTGI